MSTATKIDISAMTANNPSVDTRLLREYERLVKPIEEHGVLNVSHYTLKRALDDRVSDLVGHHMRSESRSGASRTRKNC